MRLEAAKPHHARILAGNMRPRDVAEVQDGWGKQPLAAMLEALEGSYYARVLFHELQPLCLFGLAPLTLLSGSARFWIFASAAIDAHPIAFARASRRALPDIFEHCGLLTNFIDPSDVAAMKWMRWLGGTCVLSPVPRGGRLFAQFILVDPHRRARACQQG